MSIRNVPMCVVVCDGCGDEWWREHGVPFRHNVAARQHAEAHGWRTIPKILPSGEPAAQRASDVCPECLPGFTPQPAFPNGIRPASRPPRRPPARPLKRGTGKAGQ